MRFVILYFQAQASLQVSPSAKLLHFVIVTVWFADTAAVSSAPIALLTTSCCLFNSDTVTRSAFARYETLALLYLIYTKR